MCERSTCWPGYAIVALWLLAAPVWAQQASGIRVEGGFSMPVFENGIPKYLINGETAKALSVRGPLQITQFRLESYRTNKVLELTISASECLVDIDGQSAWSPGPIQVQSADGQLRIAGEGFLWRVTNAALVISNRVETVIRRGATNAPGESATRAARAPDTNAPTTITSRQAQFDIQAKVVVYQDNVRVDDPEMELACGLLTVKLRPTGGTESTPARHAVDSISARRDVKVRGKQNGSEAMADEAVYTEATDQVELSGNASFQQGTRTGRGDRLVFNRRDGAFSAEGRAVVEFPREAVSRMGLLLTPLAATNAAPSPAGLVEAFADSISSRSNLTVLRGNVRLVDSTNRLTCGLLTLKSAAADDPEETATAEENVAVEQGNRRVWADRAVHTKSAQTVVFTGNPRWSIDQREGRSERLVLNLKENVARAVNAAYVKIPLGVGGQRLDLLPRPGTKASPETGGAQAIEIFADDLEIRASVATFTGHVRANELPAGDAQQRLACGVMTIKFTAPSNQIEQIEARLGVTIEQGARGATNAAAAWQKFSCDTLTARVGPAAGLLDTATARGGVVIERDLMRATGSEAFYAAAKGTLELTGKPDLTTPQLVITEAEALVWDLVRDEYSARGNFKMKLFPEARDQPGPFQRRKNQTAQRD